MKCLFKVIFFSLCILNTAWSQIIYVDINASGNSDGSTWENAYTDLQHALAAAESGDLVYVAEGTYYPGEAGNREATFLLPENVSVYGGFSGWSGGVAPGVEETHHNQANPYLYYTVLSGDLDQDGLLNDGNAYHVVTAGNNSLLQGVTITMGNANGSGEAVNGGGVYVPTDISFELRDCHVTHNYAGTRGGGLYSWGGTIRIIESAFSDNSANHGGGVFLRNTANVDIVNSRFTGNTASLYGGAIHLMQSTLHVYGSAFSGNKAGYGGAVWNQGTVNASYINCSFVSNDSTVRAGGMANWQGANPVIRNSIFRGNQAPDGEGPEIYNSESMPSIAYSVIEGGINGTKMDGDDATDGGNNNDVNPGFRGIAANGTWGNVSFDPMTGTTTLTDTSANWVPGRFAGLYLNADTSNMLQYLILANTQDTITILGNHVDMTDYVVNDYRLQSSSPVRANGDISAVPVDTYDIDNDGDTSERLPVDLYGEQRVLGGGVSRGAYEAMPTSGGMGGIIYVDADIRDGVGDGSSWGNAFRHLEYALGVAGTGEQIWVAGGTYVPTRGYDLTASFVLPAGVSVYGGFAGGESAVDDRDWRVNETVLSGDLFGDDVGFLNMDDNVAHVVRGASDVLLDGFTLTGGHAARSELDQPSGGGMINYDATGMIVANCLFIHNQALSGGAVYNAGGDPLFMNCRFIANQAAGESWAMGGAVASVMSETVFSNCVFTANQATGRGGAVVMSESVPVFTHSLFIGNLSQMGSGGAISLEQCDSQIIHCTFFGNETLNSDEGGAVGLLSVNGATLVNSIFENNRGNDNVQHVWISGAQPAEISYSALFGALPTGAYTDGGGMLDTGTADFAAFTDTGVWDSSATYHHASRTSVLHDGSQSWVPGRLAGYYLHPVPDDPRRFPIVANDETTVTVLGDLSDMSLDGQSYGIKSYHLRSTTGRYDPGLDAFVPDTIHSVCIDAGDPDGDFSQEPIPNGGRVNMGAYGGTPLASRTEGFCSITAVAGHGGSIDPVGEVWVPDGTNITFTITADSEYEIESVWVNHVSVGVTHAYTFNGVTNGGQRIQAVFRNVNAPDGMVLVPGGTNEGTDPDFGPYSLTTDSFYMDLMHVTKEQWDEVYNWAVTNGYVFDNAGSGKETDHPAQEVSWYDAVKWCNARSEMEGRTPAYYTTNLHESAYVYRTGQIDLEAGAHVNWNAGYRLPSDEEWEYAARGGLQDKRFPWGDTITHNEANFQNTGGEPYAEGTTGYHPVYDDGTQPYTSPGGAFAPNGYGLYDMAGNVWAWCFDWHPDNVGSRRVLRGGSWDRFAHRCRVGSRFDHGPAYANFSIGFRAVLPWQEPTPPAISVSPPTDITPTTAWLNGQLLDTGGATDTEVWFVYGTNDFGTVDTNLWSHVEYAGSFSVEGPLQIQVTDLAPDWPYYYRIFASNEFGTAWSDAPAVTNFWTAPDQFAITAVAGHGGSIDPEGEVWVPYGSNITFTIMADSEYEIESVWVNHVSVGVTNAYTFYGVTNGGQRIQAVFRYVNAPEGMVLVPGGTNEGTDPDYGPYSLTVDSFYMDATHVTKEQWDVVYNWATNNGYQFDNSGLGKDTNHPVHTVNWYDAVKWCNARSEMEGRIPAYYTDAAHTTVYRTGANDLEDTWVNWDAGYRLPLNEEWEYAARGSLQDKRFPWGNTISHDYANYRARPDGTFPYEEHQGYEVLTYHPQYHNGAAPYTSPGRAFAPNRYGLYDMGGNIRAWGFDWNTLDRRVLRGGYWDGTANNSRTGFRIGVLSASATTILGFRTVLPPGPAIRNLVPSNITTNSALLRGEVLSTGPFVTNIADVVIYWGEIDGGTDELLWDNSDYIGLRPIGAFSNHVATLQPGTRYYYRAYVSNEFGSAWAPSSESFWTHPDGEYPSAMDGFEVSVDGTVLAAGTQLDGGMIIGGSFTSVDGTSRLNLARLLPDGKLDEDFDVAVDGPVQAIVIQPDGAIVLGGEFGTVAGEPRRHIARLYADGSIDTVFDPNADDYVYSLVWRNDMIIMGGQFADVGGMPRAGMALLSADGDVDTAFQPEVEGVVRAIAVRPDGGILLGGLFDEVDGLPRMNLARLHPDGTLDEGFVTGTDGQVNSIALQLDGRVLLGGRFMSIAGSGTPRIGRLHPDGMFDDTFNVTVNNEVNALLVQANGGILVGGQFTSISGQPRRKLARLHPAGTLDMSFIADASNNPQDAVHVMHERPDEKLLIGGQFATIAGITRHNVALLYSGSTLDHHLNVNVAGAVNALAVQPDGRILIGGEFSSVNGQGRNRIARLHPDGTLDMAFTNGVDNIVMGIVLQDDGRILVGGFFDQFGGITRNKIARLNPDGSLDMGFNPNVQGPEGVRAIQVLPDEKILIGGRFDSVMGQLRNNLARLHSDGTLDMDFTIGVNGNVNSIAVDHDGGIIISGAFTQVAGIERLHIARLLPSGDLDMDFDPGADDSVYAVTTLPDGNLMVCGAFTNFGGIGRNHIARIDTAGNVDAGFQADVNDRIRSMAIDSQGRIVIGGLFSMIEGQPRSGIARLYPDGTLDGVFVLGANGEVRAVLLQPDGKILAGGTFGQIGGEFRQRFARLAAGETAFRDLEIAEDGQSIAFYGHGAGPAFHRVLFEQSTDGYTWTELGEGAFFDDNWELYGIDLPKGIPAYVRARGYYRGGRYMNSGMHHDMVKQYFLQPLTVHGRPPMDLMPDSAELRGELAHLGGGSMAGVTVVWGENDYGTTDIGAWPNSQYLGLHDIGPLNYWVDGLTSGGGYYYRFHASNDTGEAWSQPSVYFETPLEDVYPYFKVYGIPDAVMAGTPQTVTVEAWYGDELMVNYTGTVYFSSWDAATEVPIDYAFLPSDNGVRIFTNAVTFHTLGQFNDIQVRDSMDSGMYGMQKGIFAYAGYADTAEKLMVWNYPWRSYTGEWHTVSIAAIDHAWNLATNYTGTVHFSTDDPAASLPPGGTASYSFSALDGGWRTFTNDFQFNTVGIHWLRAEDDSNPDIYNIQHDLIAMGHGVSTQVTHLVINSIRRTQPGIGNHFQVMAHNIYEQQVESFTGLVEFSCSDPDAEYPDSYLFEPHDRGWASFDEALIFHTLGIHTFTATWAEDTLISGSLEVEVYDDQPQPWFAVEPVRNALWGENWPASEIVAIRVGPEGSPLYEETTDTDEWGNWNLWNIDFDFEEGQTVAVSSAGILKEHIITALQVIDVDVENDRISGTAEPYSMVQVFVWDDDHVERWVEADIDGVWEADFSVQVGPEQWNRAYNLVLGSEGSAEQQDDDGDRTFIEWRLPRPYFHVNPRSDAILGRDWPANHEIQIEVGIDLENPDYTTSIWSDQDGYWKWWVDDVPINITTGIQVRVMHGDIVKEHTVRELGWFPVVDAAAKTVSGTAAPGERVVVSAWGSYHEVTVGPDGFWTVDLSGAEGSSGDILIEDEDGDATMIPWHYDQVAEDLFVGWFETSVPDEDVLGIFFFKLVGNGIHAAQIKTPLGIWYDLDMVDWWGNDWAIEFERESVALLDEDFPSGTYEVVTMGTEGVATNSFDTSGVSDWPPEAPRLLTPAHGAENVSIPDAWVTWEEPENTNFDVFNLIIKSDDGSVFTEVYWGDTSTTTFLMTNLVADSQFVIDLSFANIMEGETPVYDISYTAVRERIVYSAFTTASDAGSPSITSSSSTGGSIAPSGTVSVIYGANQTFTITPDPSYHIADVVVNGTSVGVTNEYTFVAVTNSAQTIHATFAINEYTVTYLAEPGGTISGVATQVVAHGADADTVEAVADTGYHFVQWDDGVSTSLRTDAAVTNDITVTAQFMPNAYDLVVASVHGMPVPALGVHTNNHGAIITNMVDAVVEAGTTQYVNIGWVMTGNEPFSGTSNSFSMVVTNNAVLTWQWTTNYWLEIGMHTDGTVDHESDWYPAGSTNVLSATANTNYMFTGWTGDIESSDNPLTVVMDTPLSIQPNFVYAEYEIMASAGPGGSIAPSGSVWVAYGSNMTFTITADTGYSISEVYVDGVDPVGPTNSYTFVNVTNTGHTIDAFFSVNQYTLTFDSTGGSEVGAITQDFGTEITPPDDPVREGYSFAGWDPELPETMPATNQTHMAQWTIEQFTLTFDSAGGSVVDSITQDFGAEITPPDDPVRVGYSFAGWDPPLPSMMPAFNQTHTAQWLEDPDEGAISVILAPDAANALGGQWRLTTGPDTTWKESGQSVTVLMDEGPYTVTFAEITGWQRPDDLIAVAVVTGETTALSGRYHMDNMVFIPGNLFQMGVSGGEGGHPVMLSDFYMDTTPVTVGQFMAFAQATGFAMPQPPTWGGNTELQWADIDLATPMVNVTWNQAKAYAAWVGKRLPTEAEYEFAMRSGNLDQLYPWGDAISSEDANYNNHVGHPTVVGSYPANAYGLYDIAGNVWEWCSDWYAYISDGGDLVTDPQGAPEGVYKMIRGGSFVSRPIRLQVPWRHYYTPDTRAADLGFRCARDADMFVEESEPVPDWWVQWHFGDGSGKELAGDFDPDMDSDGDGMSDWEEYLAGTDPHDPASVLAIESVKLTDEGIVVQWQSVAGKYYSLQRSSDLTGGFKNIATGIGGTPPMNSYLDGADGAGPWFYRVVLE